MSIQSTLFLFFITVFSTQALAETCATNPGNCTPVQLCEKSTEVSAGKTYWIGDETNSYLKVARQFGLDCGALDALSSCHQDADECGIEELCKIATTLTGSKPSWNQDRKNHVELAKSFGLNCGVSASVLVEQSIVKSSTSTAFSRCEENLSECVAADLCQTATYGMLGAKDWKVGSYVKFVDEAKRPGLGCDVISKPPEDKTALPVNKDEVETEILTARDSCETDLAVCNEAVLCDLATYGPLGNKKWKVENYTNFIEEAARRNINCGVDITAITALAEDIRKEVVSEEKQDIVAEIVRSNAREICDANLAECRTVELCDLATFGMAGATEWKIGSYTKFVDEAKRRSENCGVLDEEQILSYKPDAELCDHATHESSKGLRWNVGSEKIFVEQAKRSVNTEEIFKEVKRRELSCNVESDELVDLDVAQIQTRLHHFGYEPGLIDGAWGRKTETAFQEFLNDNSKTNLSPKSLEAETFLYDLYEQEFEQTVRSSVPCKTITDDYERTNMGDCVVIGHFDEKNKELESQWDRKEIYPHLRDAFGKTLELVMWSPDQPVKPWTKHGGPSLAQMVNVKFDIEKIFEEKTKLAFKNNSRKMPFSVRRYELNDLNADGLQELFLLGSREDGRGEWNKPRVDKVPSNMIDFNFIYDFEKDRVTTFGEKTFSHDHGIHDFDGDGFKDILDMTLSERGGKRSYLYYDGKSLNCRWKTSDQFINGNTFKDYDSNTGKVLMNARCGKRYSNEGFYGKFELCWFEMKKTGMGLSFKFINKFELQKGYNAKITWQTFFGDLKPFAPRAWKVDGHSVNERVRKSAGGTATNFRDLDQDGDLDMITYRRDDYCVKKDKSRNFYSSKDCNKYTHFDYIFVQNNGKFELSQIIEGGIRDETIAYNFFDLNEDGYPDILPRGSRGGKCNDTYENVLLNKGDGTFKRADQKYSGRYSCELVNNFFEHNGQKYRAFTFKPEVKEHTYSD
ncbi:hypothetical protein N9413_06945, partial [Paracoccaceae bacterium]|nr:hypothetical protein [Paracoccaceae bacterium]